MGMSRRFGKGRIARSIHLFESVDTIHNANSTRFVRKVHVAGKVFVTGSLTGTSSGNHGERGRMPQPNAPDQGGRLAHLVHTASGFSMERSVARATLGRDNGI